MNCALLQDQIFKTTVEMQDYKNKRELPDPFPETTTTRHAPTDEEGISSESNPAEKCAHIGIATIRIFESTHDADDRSKPSQPILHNMYIFI